MAARLIESGIGSVLAMNYSVYVEATRILTSAFYGALAGGATIGQAVDAARLEMLMDTERLTLYREGKEEIIHLRDWFLPALYQQAGDPVAFALSPTPLPVGEGPGARVPAYPARGGFPPEPGHGFYGREKELLHLRRTLAERAIVVLHGYGGQGKTALSAHAARWFTRTGLFERAVFVSFERGGGLEYALAEMGAALVSDDFAIHQGDPVETIADALRQTATLAVWDNFESVLRGGDAPLPDEQMTRLLDAAAAWFSPPLSRRDGGGGRGWGFPSPHHHPRPVAPASRAGAGPPDGAHAIARPGLGRRARAGCADSAGSRHPAPAARGAGPPARFFRRPPAFDSTRGAAPKRLHARKTSGRV